VAPFTFIGGFLLDSFTLRRIDIWIDHLILILYLAAAGIGAALLNLYESRVFSDNIQPDKSNIETAATTFGQNQGLLRKVRNKSGRLRFFDVFESAMPFMPVLMQFGLGGLFSAFVIFYTKSSALGREWLFILGLAALWIGNEKFRKKYQRAAFRLSVFFVAIFSYAIFALPVFTGKMGDDIFMLSGLVSLAFIGFFILLLYFIAPIQTKQNLKTIALSIGIIYITFNILYLLNIIPPIPLSLMESGVYHLVRREENGRYSVLYEPAPGLFFFKETNPVYHWEPGSPVYFFSSVFAPTKLNTSILHRWSYYDETKGAWIFRENIKFPIVGGRDGGYRGYSFKTAITPGKWKVEVITEKGQVLGKEEFRVVKTEGKITLREGLK